MSQPYPDLPVHQGFTRINDGGLQPWWGSRDLKQYVDADRLQRPTVLPAEAVDILRTYQSKLGPHREGCSEGGQRMWDRIEAVLAASRCKYCDGSGDVHSPTGEWLGVCTECPAASERDFETWAIARGFDMSHDLTGYHSERTEAAAQGWEACAILDRARVVPTPEAEWARDRPAILTAIRHSGLQLFKTDKQTYRLDKAIRGVAEASSTPAEPTAADSDLLARYRFLIGFLIEKGVLTNKRYPNATWVLRGVYGVDDSGIKGAGRNPEEAIDNAITANALDPHARDSFWSATNEALKPSADEAFQAMQALVEGVMTRADAGTMETRLNAAVKVMASRGVEPPVVPPYLQHDDGSDFRVLAGFEVGPVLLNLLASIHNDGGHHTNKVGLEQSIKDALCIVRLPGPGSAEASAAIDKVLEEYDFPSNPKNAGRAGWVAARRMIDTLRPQEPRDERASFEAWAFAEWNGKSVPDAAWLGWKGRSEL